MNIERVRYEQERQSLFDSDRQGRASGPTLQAAYRQKDWSVSGGCYLLAFVELDMTRHSAHIVRVKQRHRSRIAHFNETQIDDATAVSKVQSIKTV